MAPDLVDEAQLSALQSTTWKLEVVLGRMNGPVGPFSLQCLHALQLSLPNKAHLLAALHLARGGIHATLNFDEGIEIAYRLLTGETPLPSGSNPAFAAALPDWQSLLPPQCLERLPVVAGDQEFEQWASDGMPYPALLKLHGSVRSTQDRVELVDPIVLDELEFAQLSTAKLCALDAVGQCQRVLITGYSGLDIDVYQPLLERLTRSAVTWATLDLSSAVRGDLAKLPEATSLERAKGHADSALAALLGLSNPPDWPSTVAPGPSYEQRLEAWTSQLRSKVEPGSRAEAYAWLLADGGQYSEAVPLLVRLASRQEKVKPRLINRLADVYYDRNGNGDRRRARKLWYRILIHRAAPLGLRAYASTRIGESYRQTAVRGPLLLRPGALVAATIGPVASLVITGNGRRAPLEAARAYSALSGLGLRVLEATPVRLLLIARRGAERLARASSVAGQRALTLRPGGNRQLFVRQQMAELKIMLAILAGNRCPEDAAAELRRVRDTYKAAEDLRGVTNSTAGLALAAIADGDQSLAHRLLDEAEQGYCNSRKSQPPDPSGLALVDRRRRLCGAFRTHS